MTYSPLSFFKVSVHDPVFLVPLSLVPADPCDVHLELTGDDQISIASSSNEGDPTSALGNTGSGVPLSHDPSSLTAYWDSGGIELELGLDSGVSLPRATHSFEETNEH